MISIPSLRKIANAAPLLPPPGDEVVLDLVQEIYRLHEKLFKIHETTKEPETKELAFEQMYDKDDPTKYRD